LAGKNIRGQHDIPRQTHFRMESRQQTHFQIPILGKKTYKRQKNAPEKQIAFPERLLFLSSVIR
jgi:hypothetical protein